MFQKEPFSYKLIETQEDLSAFVVEHKSLKWLAFDTEFIGERRYSTLLCLIQIATVNGFYLIDPFKVQDLRPFLSLITDPSILKITHAGENDYKILYQDFGIVPCNIFDIQLAAGFVGYNYPASFQRLVEQELNIGLDKSYVVADWEARPIRRKAIDYALNDVAFLYRLYEKLLFQLKKNKRLEWVQSEFRRWEKPSFYIRDPHAEALNSTLMYGLKRQKQIFLIRLYEWRRSEAQRLNYSKEMVLAGKHISAIMKGMEGGKQALLDNRTIPNGTISQHWHVFEELYKRPASAEELAILARLPLPNMGETPRQAVSMELLHALVKYRCVEMGIATSLVMNKSDLTYAQQGEDIFENEDWRKAFLGADLLEWINKRTELKIEMSEGKVTLTMP